MASTEDVNGDGLIDLLVHIETEGLDLVEGSTFDEGTLFPLSPTDAPARVTAKMERWSGSPSIASLIDFKPVIPVRVPVSPH